jgi:two-component system invasion response regulator UvrY
MDPKNRPLVFIIAAAADAEEIGSIVDTHFDYELVSTPASIDHLLTHIASSAAGIVVIDSDLPGLDAPTAIYEIKHLDSKPGVVVLADRADTAGLLSAFREGADAYLVTASLREELIPALEAVEAGRVCFNLEDADAIRHHLLYLELGSARNVTEVKNGVARLTVRQKEVFPLLADGKSIKEIANILGISPKTVETHKYHIMQKLNVDRLADLTKLAIIKDLIPL